MARKRLRNKPGNNQLLKSSQAKSSSTKTTTNDQPEIRQNSDSLPNEDSTSSCSRTNSKYCKSITTSNLNDDQTVEPNRTAELQAGHQRLANSNCTYQDTNNNPLVQSTTDLSSSSPATTIIELHSSTNTPMHLLDGSTPVQQNGNLNGGLQKGGGGTAQQVSLPAAGQQMTELLPMKQLSAGKAYSVVIADNDRTTTTLILAEESSTQFNVDEQLVVTCNGGGSSEMSTADESKSSMKKNKLNKQTNQSNMSKEMAARLKQKQQQDSKRERKTARILAIITGVFVVSDRKRIVCVPKSLQQNLIQLINLLFPTSVQVCWLPFFVLTLLKTFIPKYREYNLLFSIFLWLDRKSVV